MSGFKINRQGIEKMQREIAKEFERAARRHPVRVPIHAEPPAAVYATAQAPPAIEADAYLSRLLIWLDELARLQPGAFANVARFVEGEDIAAEEAEGLALLLEKLGFAQVAQPTFDEATVEVYLSGEGRLEARRLKLLQSDQAARFGHACDALLHWVFAARTANEVIELMAFVESPRSYFAGDSLTVDEILQAAKYLNQKQLLRFVDVDATSPTTIRASITNAGIDCVLSGGTVSDHLSRQQRGGDTYNITDSRGFVAGSQASVVQNNSFGLDASALADFAALVLQMAPTLGVSTEQQSELIQDAEVLEEEAAAAEPNPGRLRSAYARVNAALASITTTTAGLAVLLQQGQAAYATVFGG